MKALRQGVTSLASLGQEAYYHNKEKKAAEKAALQGGGSANGGLAPNYPNNQYVARSSSDALRRRSHSPYEDRAGDECHEGYNEGNGAIHDKDDWDLDEETMYNAGTDTGPARKTKSSTGVKGEAEVPETAPLVFPYSKEQTGAEVPGAGKFKRASEFSADYFDRRTQAIFNAKTPDSTCTSLQPIANPSLRGTYADPNSAANQGGLYGALTGGRMTSGGDRGYRGGRRGPLGAVKGIVHTAVKVGTLGSVGYVKRWMADKVIYLCVVEKPTAEDMRTAEHEMQQLKANHKN